MREVVRVGGLAGRPVGELGRHRLAEEHGARRAQALDADRVLFRAVPGVDGRAVGGRHVRGVDDVLEPERDAVQAALRRHRIAPRRHRQRRRPVDVLPGADRGLARLDAGEAILRDGNGGGLSLAQARREAVHRQFVKSRHALVLPFFPEYTTPRPARHCQAKGRSI